MTSGSTKYTFGGAFGPKSRGGVVMTLGGSAGFAACASTTRGAMNATPAAVATVFIAVRREIALLGTIGSSEREALHETSGPFVSQTADPWARASLCFMLIAPQEGGPTWGPT